MPDMPPLWLTIEIEPGVSASISPSIEPKVAMRPIDQFMMPRQFGPHSLTPARAQASASRSWSCRPSSPTSAKPPAHSTTAGMPTSPHWSTSSIAAGPGTERIARSGTPGSSRRLA